MRLSFDSIASQFDDQRGLPRDAVVAWMGLIESIAGENRFRIIEPGIGTGRIALPLAAMGHRVTGTDISRQMLEQCARAARDLEVNLLEADATDLPAGDPQFDLGIVAQLLYLVTDWPAVLDELARVVKPGGFVIHLTEPTTENDDLKLWSSTWREMIESTGYRHTPLKPTDHDVHLEFTRRWPDVHVQQLANWTLGQSVAEARQNYSERLRPLYREIPEQDFDRVIERFLNWSNDAFPDPATRLDATVTLTALIASV